jgi:hypothetical protein
MYEIPADDVRKCGTEGWRGRQLCVCGCVGVCTRAWACAYVCYVCVSMHVCVATKSKQTAKVPAKWLAAYDVGGK